MLVQQVHVVGGVAVEVVAVADGSHGGVQASHLEALELQGEGLRLAELEVQLDVY